MSIRLARILRRRQPNDDGASAVEYGLLVAAIATVLVAVVFGLGSLVRDVFSKTSTCITTSGSSTC